MPLSGLFRQKANHFPGTWLCRKQKSPTGSIGLLGLKREVYAGTTLTVFFLKGPLVVKFTVPVIFANSV